MLHIVMEIVYKNGYLSKIQDLSKIIIYLRYTVFVFECDLLNSIFKP